MTALAWHLERAAEVLRSRYGYPAFRPGQLRAVRAALAGRSALVVLPTGGGKSVCYQVPALVLDGLTVVVSPLISLMQDQVQAARGRGIWAAALTSAMTPVERQRVLRDLAGGGLKLLYVAPERLATGALIGALKRWVSSKSGQVNPLTSAHVNPMYTITMSLSCRCRCIHAPFQAFRNYRFSGTTSFVKEGKCGATQSTTTVTPQMKKEPCKTCPPLL